VQIKFFIAVLAIGLLLAAGNYATGQPQSKSVKWEYTIYKHSPHLTESGTEFKEIQQMGNEGWELASSYTARGEIVVSIFKRQK